MRHLSFDFWNTLGKPSKDYSRERTAMLARVFGVSLAEAKVGYTLIKGRLDRLAEKEGVSVSRTANVMLLCDFFGREDSYDVLHGEIEDEMDRLFRLHPPTIPDDLRTALNRAHDMGITMSVVSNTNFVNGVELQKVLDGLPFGSMFFSDVVRVSKPNPRIFQVMAGAAMMVNPAIKQMSDITHVGDHKVCDGEGCVALGMRFAYTENADTTAAVLNALLDRVA